MATILSNCISSEALPRCRCRFGFVSMSASALAERFGAAGTRFAIAVSSVTSASTSASAAGAATAASASAASAAATAAFAFFGGIAWPGLRRPTPGLKPKWLPIQRS